MGLLRRLLNDQIHTVQRTNLVQARKFSEQLEEAINKYTNRSLTTAEIIAELVKLAKQMRNDAKRHEELGLAEDEIAFYDALEENEAAVRDMRHETLVQLAQELTMKVRGNVRIDWSVRESTRAALRVLVRDLLDKYGYPPDFSNEAIDTVMRQAEALTEDWLEGGNRT